MTPLVQMSLWQVRNAVRQTLRDPRRWVLALLAAVFVLFQLRAVAEGGVALPPEYGAVLRAHKGAVGAGVFLLLCLMALSYINQGLTGGVLSFSAADGAYLFPSPAARHVVLLTKLPGAVGPLMVTLLGTAWAFRSFVWLPLGGAHSGGGGWAAIGAALLCMGGWLNIAVAVELIFGVGQYARWQRALNIGVFVLVGLIGLACWRYGLAGLGAVTNSGPLPWLFWPCRAAATAAMAPLLGAGGHAPLWTWPALALWYGGTLAALLARRDNYYEAAARGTALLQKRREARQAGRFGSGTIKAGTRTGSKPYSVPPFGTGGMALLWAHLAAAAKRPVAAFIVPLLGGVVAGAACVWTVGMTTAPGANADDGLGLAQLVPMIVGAYVYAFVFSVGLSHYQQSLLRHTLVRPLPLPAWQAVAGEVGARTLLQSLPGWTLSLTLGVLHPRGWGALMLPLCVTLPLFVFGLNCVLHRVALWYPSAADRVQMFTAAMVQILVAGLWVGLLSTVGTLPNVLASRHLIPDAAAPRLADVFLLAACTASAVLLLRWNVRAYARWEPAEGSNTRRRATFRPPSVSHLLSMNKKRIRGIVVALVVVLALLFAGGRVAKNLHKPLPPPRTAAARRGDLIVSVSESGTVQPVDKVDVKSKVGGRLLSVPITEGQRVTAGQLMATVDRSQIDPQIAGLRAQLAEAQARLAQSIAAYNLQVAQSRMAVAQARASLRTTQTHLNVVAAPARTQDVAQQQQAVARAQIELADAERTRARRLALLAKGFISQADADATQVAVDTAQSTLASAQQQLALLRAGARPVDVTDAQAGVNAARVAVQTAQANSGQNAVALTAIAQSRAAIAQTQNALAQLEVKLADTRIVAPTNGIVLKKYRQVGEIVQDATTGFSDTQSLIATLGSKLEVRVGINEVDIPKVRVGLPVVLHVDALPGATFAGHVTEIAPASSNAFADASAAQGGSSGIAKFPVKVGLDKDDPRLRPGMTTDVQIISTRHRGVILAPLEAVPGTGKTAKVTVLTPSNQKQPRTLTLGLRNDTSVEVLSGLKAGDKIVIPAIDASGRRKIEIGGGG